MSQPLISSFFQNKKTSLKRTFQEVVSELIKVGEEVFEAKNLKVKQTNSGEAHQEGLSNLLPKMSYKKYTLNQKTAILNLIPYVTTYQIEKEFWVDEATVRYWIKHGLKDDQRKENGKKVQYEEVEKTLLENLLSMREKGNPVTSSVIFQEMKNVLWNDMALIKTNTTFSKIMPGIVLVKIKSMIQF